MINGSKYVLEYVDLVCCTTIFFLQICTESLFTHSLNKHLP